MRTTLDLDDDVLGAARALARAQGVSIGHAVSELVRVGLAPRPLVDDAGLAYFPVPADAPVITDDMVAAAVDDD